MQKRLTTPLCPRLLLCAAGLCLFAANSSRGLAQSSRISTATAQTSSAATGYVLDGMFQAEEQTKVAAQTSGRIATSLVKYGHPVRSGQMLATVDDLEAQIGMQHAQAQVT